MAAHTPEPWTVDGTKALGAYGVWTDYATHPGHDGAGYGSLICSFELSSPHISREQRDANAQRICAAVNACQGIPTAALESGVVAELLAALEEFVGYYDQAGMPAWLTDAVEDDPPDGFDGDEVHNVRLGRAALAKTKEPTP